MAFAPTVVVDSGSDVSTFPTANVPVSQGGTITESETDSEFVAVSQLQVAVTTNGPWQEVNLFVGEIAAKYSIAPHAAIRAITQRLHAMEQQFYHA